MKEIFADQPGRPKPIVDQAPPKAVPAGSTATPPAPAPPPAALPHLVAPEPALQAHGLEQHAGALIETGLRFLESLAAIVQSTLAGTTAEQPLGQRLSSLVSHDPNTGRKTLSIPLPQLIDEDRLTRAIRRRPERVWAFGLGHIQPEHRWRVLVKVQYACIDYHKLWCDSRTTASIARRGGHEQKSRGKSRAGQGA